MIDASIIETAARDGFTTYFGDRPGRTWPEPPAWTPESQTWRVFAARILNGELTSPKAAYEHYVDIRAAKTWAELAPARRDHWAGVYWAIQRHSTEPTRITQAVTRTTRTEARAA